MPTKKSPAQLQREIDEALAARPKLSKHQLDLLSRRGRGGELRAGYLTPAGWHGDPMAIEDRKLRLEALREQPAPRLPKEPSRSHATKKKGSHATKRGSTGKLEGRTMAEAAAAGDSYQLVAPDGRSLWMPGIRGIKATLKAARSHQAWAHRIGQRVKIERVLPGSGVGSMYVEEVGEATL